VWWYGHIEGMGEHRGPYCHIQWASIWRCGRRDQGHDGLKEIHRVMEGNNFKDRARMIN
jgi:hypothetical protein